MIWSFHVWVDMSSLDMSICLRYIIRGVTIGFLVGFDSFYNHLGFFLVGFMLLFPSFM